MLSASGIEYTKEDSHVPTPSLGTVFNTAYDSAFEQGSFLSWNRLNNMEEAEKTGHMIEPDEALKLFGVNVKNPISELAAQKIKDARIEREIRQDILSRGTEESLVGKAVNLIGGMAGAMSDPADLVIGAALGFGANAAARAVGASAKVAFGISMAENMTANAITETINFEASKKEQIDITAQEVLNNVVFGTVAMTGLFHAPGALVHTLGKIGRKAPGRVSNLAKVAADNGKDPAKILNHADELIAKDLEIPDNFRTALIEAAPSKATQILEDSEDIVDVMRNLGELTPEEHKALVTTATTNGFDENKFEYMNGDADIQLSKDTVTSLKREMLNEENDLGYNAEMAKVAKETPLNVEASKYDLEMEKYVKESKVELDVEAKQMFDVEEERLSVFAQVAKCKGITL